MQRLIKMMAVPMMLFSGATLANQTIELYKSESCGCCTEWAEIMEEKGYQVNVHHKPQWNEVRQSFAMPSQLQSCHTAIIDGYLIEGHVPESDIARLLEERPEKIKGLAAPGMPMHSPGMARPGDEYKDFKVIAFSADEMSIYNEY